MRWLLAALLLPTPALATRPPGDIVDPAVLVDITPDGLNRLDLLAGALVPTDLALPVVADGDEADEDCIFFGTVCWIPWRYGYEVSGFDAHVTIDDVALVPGTDVVEVSARVTVGLASAASPGLLGFSAEAADVDLFGLEFTVIDIDETCDVWLDPTPVVLETSLTLRVTPRPGADPDVEVALAPIHLDLDLSGLRIEGCAIDFLDDWVDAVRDFLGVFSFDLDQILLDLVTPILDDAIQGLVGDLSTTVADLLGSLVLDQQLDLLGKVVTLHVEPSELVVRPAGIRVAMAGSVAGDGLPDVCVAPYDPGGSLETGGRLPAIGDGLPGVDHALGVFADDDLLNQALYAIWYEGVLCLSLDSAGGLPIDLPIPLDTSLLSILSSGAFDDLFPTARPIAIVTRPRTPPVATTDGDHDVRLVVDDLGLDLYAELDGRQARMAGIVVDADLGADLDFDGQTGALGVGLDVGEGALAFSVAFNDLRPDASDAIASGIAGLVDSLVGPLLGSLLGDLAFDLPTIGGVGVSELVVAGAGPDGDLIGVFGALDTVPYEGADLLTGGCDGGCDSGGCGGCDQRGRPMPVLWLLPLLVALRRRR